MKALRFFSTLTVAVTLAACTGIAYDDTQIKKDIADLQQRMTELETRVNSNISSLTQIVTDLQQNDYIVSYAPYIENQTQVGWQLNFAKNGSVIIYFGKDGKDGKDGSDGAPGKDGQAGQNGKDGRDGTDGHTPQISVRQDTDGIWYWTLDGEWLLDANGAKVKAVGTDGKDGQDGLNGGHDVVTPQFEIEDGYWFLSLDDGHTWIQVGKATGEKGDSFFKSVTEDDNYVYLTLSDETVINIPKASTLEVTFNPAGNIFLETGVEQTISYEVTSSLTPVTVEVVTSSDIKARVSPAKADGLSGTITVVAQSETDKYSKLVVIVDNGARVLTKVYNTGNGGLRGPSSGTINDHEWVDLGLPSGILWATCNVGASQPEEYGDYYAWGDTEPNYTSLDPMTWKSGKEEGFTWTSYKFRISGDSSAATPVQLSKYNTSDTYGQIDNLTSLELTDDAARANWGGSWRMPTIDEWAELMDNCTWTEVTHNGVLGRLVTGSNANSIFIPAAGGMGSAKFLSPGKSVYYWSSSLYTRIPYNAWYFTFSEYGLHRGHQQRYYGFSVRPVSD